MHLNCCVHRELKPENVLLSDNTDEAEIKVVDFGLSRFFEESERILTMCGTHKYLAPEVVLCDRRKNHGYDNAIDMWGVGLLTFFMLFGFNPFAKEKQVDTLNAIARCDWHFPGSCDVSKDAKSFVEHLLCKSPRRYTAQKTLQHKWLDRAAPSAFAIGGPVDPVVSNRTAQPSPEQTAPIRGHMNNSIAHSAYLTVGHLGNVLGAHGRTGRRRGLRNGLCVIQ